jgi:hypothetical protein
VSEWGPALGTQSGLASPVSNMTYFAEERRLEMDAVLKKAGHTVRLGEFETCPNWGPGVDTRRWIVWISMKELHF